MKNHGINADINEDGSYVGTDFKESDVRSTMKYNVPHHPGTVPYTNPMMAMVIMPTDEDMD
jgi:hypothetical protein